LWDRVLDDEETDCTVQILAAPDGPGLWNVKRTVLQQRNDDDAAALLIDPMFAE